MSCPRELEVDAARDGRLADQTAIERHMRTCAACSARADALCRLARTLRELPVPLDDELNARRQRHRLLADFDIESRKPRRSFVSWTLAAIIAVGAAVTIWLVASGSASPPVASRDLVEIRAEHARWSRLDVGATSVVRLDDGKAEFRVDHRGSSRRLVVVVPDGEIEDLGTTFDVEVQHGRTITVHVREGAVVLRRAHQAPLMLKAGDDWRDHDTTTGPPAIPLSPAVATPRTLSKAPGAVIRTPPRVPETASGAATVARDFRSAVELLDGGDNASAAAALRSFVSRYVDDPRAEDAAYLLVLALQRAGDHGGTRDAARAYLQRYPHGFRQRSIMSIIDSL